MRNATQGVQLRAGEVLSARSLRAIDGAIVQIPDAEGSLVHLQFRRFAGCPICSLHLRSFARRHDELVAAGIREVAVFHSSQEDLVRVQKQPFAVIADPKKVLYAEFGVGTSPAAMLDPRVWPTAMRALASRASSDPTAGMESGSSGLPADFLIASDGRLLAVKYGVNADDQWSVDELLALVREAVHTSNEARVTA